MIEKYFSLEPAPKVISMLVVCGCMKKKYILGKWLCSISKRNDISALICYKE